MIGLFTGIETFTWKQTDFDALINFCKKYGVGQIILKVYEITQGYWPTDQINGTDIVTYIKQQGIDVMPYGFFYGGNIAVETTAIKHLLDTYGIFCLDMEGDFDNDTAKTQTFHDVLKGTPGQIWVSTWANPVSHGWHNNIAILDEIVTGWMPQAYTDNLIKDMYSQFPKVQGKIQPTFHIVNTPYPDASPYKDFTLWEYQLARNDINDLVSYVKQNNGEQVTNYPTNPKGMIANYLPVSEFQPNHSEFECGAFAVALNARATNSTVQNNNSLGNLINWAEAAYAFTTGSNGSSNTLGASIDDMHTMLKKTQDKSWPVINGVNISAPNALHWWDITSISPGSLQEHDIAEIKAALEHGYPVIATVPETSVFDLDLGRNPYWWGPTGNHILTWVGIAHDGNLLAIDPANVIKGDGNLQTPKTVQTWPRRYDITRIANQWATIVQLPWLPGIVSNDPISWPPYQPTNNPPPPSPPHAVVPFYDPTSKQLMFMDGVNVIYRIQL